MTKIAHIRLIERAVHGSAKRIPVAYCTYVPPPGGQSRDGLWLWGERSAGAALEAWRAKHPDSDAGAPQCIRLVSGMTVGGGRSRSVRLWSVAPAESGVGALCTEPEALEGEAWWNPAMDVPFCPEPRRNPLKILRERFECIVRVLEDRDAELCAREIAAVLGSGEELSRLGWKEDWLFKAMRRWADGAARWEARRRTAAGGPKARQ